MHFLSPCKVLVESICNFIQSPQSILCSSICHEFVSKNCTFSKTRGSESHEASFSVSTSLLMQDWVQLFTKFRILSSAFTAHFFKWNTHSKFRYEKFEFLITLKIIQSRTLFLSFISNFKQDWRPFLPHMLGKAI